MYKLCDKIKNLTPYEPLVGDFPVRLDANESYISLPKEIVDEITEEISKVKFNRYPDALAENVCTAFAKYYGIDKKYVTAGNGSDELISIIINGFFEKGDSVAITSPEFSMYKFYSHLSELKVVNIQKNDSFIISADEIISEVICSKSKGLIISNPCNPTTCGIEKSDIIKIVESLPETLIIIDEAYMDFMGDPILKTSVKYDNLIILKTCSKNFGLAAIRLGFAVANPVITNAIRAIKSPYNVNTLSAIAGSVVLRYSDYLKDCTKKIIGQRKKLYEKLKKIKGIEVIDSKTNFVFVKVKNPEIIFKQLLFCGIAIRNLGAYLRINAGSDEENEIFLKAFKEAAVS